MGATVAVRCATRALGHTWRQIHPEQRIWCSPRPKGRRTMFFHSTTAFQIGGLAVKWYGLFIMSVVIVATLLAYSLAPLKGENAEYIWGLLPYLVVFGIIGARIAYGVVRHDQFGSPIELVTRFRTGGIAIQGAIGGACIAGWVYCRTKGI